MALNPAIDTTPGDVTAPVAPTNLTITSYGKGLMIRINAVNPTDFHHYELWKRAGAATSALFLTTPQSSVTDLEVSYGTVYNYKARSVDTSGNASAFSAEFSGTPAQFGGGDIGAGQILNVHLGAGSVLNANLGAGAVGTINIGSGAVTTITIAAGAVLTGNIGTNAVTSGAAVTLSGASAPLFGPGALLDMPGMILTFTTVGGVVLITFNATVILTNLDPSIQELSLTTYLVRDGSAMFASAGTWTYNLGPGGTGGADGFIVPSLTYLDNPAAGSHTYKVWWAVNGNVNGFNTRADRGLASMEAIEFRR